MTNRRDLLLLGLGLTGVAAGWQAWVARPQPFDFELIANLPGWRKVSTGALTQPGAATFLTIGQETTSTPRLSPEALDQALYRVPGAPPMAVFSDFFCPFCRTLTARLSRRPDLPVTWHELPLLGPPSEFAARAAVAADLQGAYADFVDALARRGFRPSLAHMESVADGIGIDGMRLRRDMDGPDVAARLTETRRAATTLGVVGTPGLTVGRTLVIGEVELSELDRVIALEKG